jgi:hypothetical protein
MLFAIAMNRLYTARRLAGHQLYAPFARIFIA